MMFQREKEKKRKREKEEKRKREKTKKIVGKIGEKQSTKIFPFFFVLPFFLIARSPSTLLWLLQDVWTYGKFN